MPSHHPVLSVILKAMLQQAISDGLLVSNPCNRARPPIRKKRLGRRSSGPGTGEAVYLPRVGQCTVVLTLWRGACSHTQVRGGARVLALRWRDVDLEGARLSIRRSRWDLYERRARA